MTRVAVVIVNMNGGSLLPRALAAVAAQTLPPARVIVVDNASSDGSADGLEQRHPGTEVIRLGENVGFAAGNNIGVAAADDCEWVALLNPDAFPEPDWLATLVAAVEASTEFTFFGSRLLRADAPEELDGAGDVLHVSGMAWRRNHGDDAAGTALEPEEIFSPCAAAALYHRDAFIGVGGFDETYFCYFEDTDLSFRLRLAGHRCLYVPEAVVHHVGSAIAGVESDFTIYHSFRNLVWTWAKNMPSPLVWLYLPQLLLVQGLLFAAFTLRGRPRVILRAQRDAVRGLPAVLQERRLVQRSRSVSPPELRRVLSRGLGGYVTTFMRGFQRLQESRPGRTPATADDRAVVVARNVFASAGAQAWMLVLALVSTPFLVHGLGVEAYGVYALVLTLLGYFAFLDLGLGIATTRHLAEQAGRGDMPAVERTLRTAIGLYLVLGTVGAAALALSAPALVSALGIATELRESATTALVLAGAGFAVAMPLAVFGAVPVALQRIDLANALNVAIATVGIGGAVAFAAGGYGLPTILAWSVATSVVALLAFVRLARCLLPGVSFRPGVSRRELRALTGFGLLKFANQLSVQTVYHVDKVLVAALVSVAAVTFYVVPVAIAQRLTALVTTVSVAFLPAATQLHAERDSERFRELVLRAQKLVALLVLPVGALLVAFAHPILDVWLGTEFAERSAWPLRFLVLGYTLSALGTIAAVACDAVGRPGVTTAFSVASAVANVGLCLALIPAFGIAGASVVILVEAGVSLPIFLTYAHRRVLGIPLGDVVRKSFVRPLAAVGIACAPMALLVPFARSWPTLILALGVSFAAYAAVARLVGAWDSVDGTVAKRSLARRPSPVRAA